MNPVVDELDADNASRVVERGVCCPLITTRPVIGYVSGERSMHPWRPVGNGRLQINRRFQRLDLELHQFRRVLRKTLALRYHQGQRVAHMTCVVADQHGALGLVHRTAIGGSHVVHAGERAFAVSPPVIAGKNRQHPRHGHRAVGTYGVDPGMGMGTADKHRVRGTGQHHVVDVLPGAGEKPPVFDSG